ncbi:MAG: hypothetical protein R3B60_03535 [Candidatus Paceibacterota bacterium]
MKLKFKILKNIKFFSGIFIFSVILINPKLTEAVNTISVSPLIIDHKTEVRDIITKEITIKNNGNVPTRLFASVHEIEIGGDDEVKSFIPASMTDRTVSITSWVEISRARIDIQPGEMISVPVTIRINPNAKPGEYHGFIGFGNGKNRDIAENKVKAGVADGVIVRISIDEKQVELLRLTSFKTDNVIYDSDNHEFSYSLKNEGDVPLTPKGEIIIYNGKGEEVTAVLLNTENVTIAPGEKVDFSEPLPKTNVFGKNKAFLSLQYGNSHLASLHDTNYYYTIPLPLLIGLIILLLLIPLTITVLLVKAGKQTDSDIRDNYEATELPVFVRKSHEHDKYEHDINLKKDL